MNELCPWCGQNTELKEVTEFIQKEYEKARKNPTVKNPVAYALYHTWRYYDRKGKRKK